MANISSATFDAICLMDIPVGFYITENDPGWITYNTDPVIMPQAVWQSSRPNLNFPFACPSTSAGGPLFTLAIDLFFPEPVNWPGGTIQPTSVPSGFAFTCHGPSRIFWTGSEGNSLVQAVHFKVTVERVQKYLATPWSININSWSLCPVGAEAFQIGGSAILEAYGIYGQQPKFIQDDGIPIELLRLFIPPSLTVNISTEQQWIQWVTTVCHGTQDPKAPFGTLRANSTQHWLRYQVWTGQPSFIWGNDGGKFNLSAWIDAYMNFKDNSDWLTTVNCFDQAGIVETVLGLGISNARLRWELKKPFGFINADLVGWGLTNNPFFEADKSLQNIQPLDDPERSPFRSHVFISISPTSTYDRQNATVVDACAGPVYELTYADYLSKCALQDGLPLLLEGNYKPTAQEFTGVSGSDGTKASSTLTDLIHGQYGGIPEEVSSILTEIQNNFSEATVPSDFNAMAVINAVLNPILANTNTTTGLVLTSQLEKPIAIITNTSTGSVTTERKLVGIVANDSEKDPTFVSFQISVFSGGVDSAVSALQSRLKLFTVPMDWAGRNKINVKKNPKADAEHITSQNIQVFGNNHLSLFVYKNTLVAVSGNSVMAYIPAWTKMMVDELSKY